MQKLDRVPFLITLLDAAKRFEALAEDRRTPLQAARIACSTVLAPKGGIGVGDDLVQAIVFYGNAKKIQGHFVECHQSVGAAPRGACVGLLRKTSRSASRLVANRRIHLRRFFYIKNLMSRRVWARQRPPSRPFPATGRWCAFRRRIILFYQLGRCGASLS